MANRLYKEEMRFRNLLALALLGTGIIAAGYGMVQAILKQATTDAFIYGGIAAGLGLLTWAVLQVRLKVSVSDKSIKYQMTPLHGKSRKIKWKEVDSCKIVRTPMLAPDHKSNIGLGGEKRFSLSGRNGLSIVTKRGERYFIGCRDVDQLRDSIQKVAG